MTENGLYVIYAPADRPDAQRVDVERAPLPTVLRLVVSAHMREPLSAPGLVALLRKAGVAQLRHTQNLLSDAVRLRIRELAAKAKDVRDLNPYLELTTFDNMGTGIRDFLRGDIRGLMLRLSKGQKKRPTSRIF
jgi:hypothetical protein